MVSKLVARSSVMALSVAAIAGIQPASAQVASPEPDAATSDGIQDIVVTARKRNESQQDVPIAISVVDGDQLVERNIATVAALTVTTPGLNVASGSGSRPQLTLRGIGTSRFDIGSESPVGVFVDEVYQARLSNLDSGLFDIDRVEVLKGPQGTLFGRNTPAGAISITTAAPTGEMSGFIEGTYGNQDRVRVVGAVSGPLSSDKLLFRVAGIYDDYDGFSRELVSGRDNGEKIYGGRAKLELRTGGRFSATLTADFTESTRDLVFLEPGASATRFLQSPTAMFTKTADPFTETYTTPGFVRRKNGGASLRMVWEGDALNITSLTAWRKSKISQAEDFDYSSLTIGITQIEEESRQVSQEIRLSSTADGFATFGGALDWQVGGYFYTDDASRTDRFTWGTQSVFAFLGGVSSQISRIPVDVRTDSYAVFGQATLSLADALKLTVGGRYTHDKKTFTLAAMSETAVNRHVVAPYTYSGDKSWSSFDPKVSLEFRPTQDAMLYATWSRGYKSGGVQFAASSLPVARVVYDPEHVTAYEVGLKSDWLDRRLRLNLAGFYYDYKDLQTQAVIVLNGAPTAVTSNAAKSRIKGVELELIAAPARGLTFTSRYAYLDAHYRQFVQDPFTGIDLSGNRMPRSPEHTVTFSGEYEFVIASDWELSLGGDIFMTSDYELSDLEDRARRVDGYALVSGRIGLRHADGGMSITLFGENLTDRRYFTYASNQGPSLNYGYAPRRTYGVRARFSY